MKRQIFAALVIASCGPCQPLQHLTGEIAATPAQPAPPPPAMRLELTALVARGELHVLDADGWRPLAAGQSIAGVTEIRVTRRAAMVSLGHGDAAGRLWLRAGAGSGSARTPPASSLPCSTAGSGSATAAPSCR